MSGGPERRIIGEPMTNESRDARRSLSDDPLEILDGTVPWSQKRLAYSGQRIRWMVWYWRAELAVAKVVGQVTRRVTSGVVRTATSLLGTAGVAVGLLTGTVPAAIAGATLLVLAAVCAAWVARRQLAIGEFRDLTSGRETQAEADGAGQESGLAELLYVELSRLGDLFNVVSDRRAVASAHGPRRSLDATLSVEALANALGGTVSADSKVSLGPFSFPLAPLSAIVTRIFQAPRLSGALHRDGDSVILTAHGGPGAHTWRVDAIAQEGADQKSSLINELALRIFTDLALGRGVRWRASQHFVLGLEKVRACLRSPKDRKVNLKEAEKQFLEALSEDEDFPLAYYNLGVVYSELHLLAGAGGRVVEATNHLSAAATAFGRAVERDPTRWETYFALAQTQFRYRQYGVVLELCERILELKLGNADRAKAYELKAMALLLNRPEESPRQAISCARKAAVHALRAVRQARLFSSSHRRPDDDGIVRSSELAAACLLRFGASFSRQLGRPDAAGSAAPGGNVLKRVKALYGLARTLASHDAELRFDLGLRGIALGMTDLAYEELNAARRSDPSRPTYTAAVALARATADAPTEEIVDHCLIALSGLAATFFPARDRRACEVTARAYDRLAERGHGWARDAADELRRVDRAVDQRLRHPDADLTVSAIYLEELGQSVVFNDLLGEAARSIGFARRLLRAAQPEHADNPDRDGLSAALVHAELATSLNPLSVVAWDTLGDVHFELADFTNAEAAWRYALSQDPDNPQLYARIGSSFWHLAFRGRSRPDDKYLTHAAQWFENALVLYGGGSVQAQQRTRYRLAKLNAALRDFDAALEHLRIVEAVAESDRPPLVGWTLMGLAYLEKRQYTECEHWFERVVGEGQALHDAGKPPTHVLGSRLDEKLWPLGLIRAWGHAGLAHSIVARDGSLRSAREYLERARELAEQVSPRAEFPTRIYASCADCEGLIHLREGKIQEAIAKLQEAVGLFPFSRSYMNLAAAYLQRAKSTEASTPADAESVERCIRHAVSLGPHAQPTEEMKAILDELQRVATQN